MTITHPTPRSTKIRRHPSGLASVELIFGEDQVRACGRCPARCKAKPIAEGSDTYRCGHRMPQDRLNGFLFAPEPAPDPDDHVSDPAARIERVPGLSRVTRFTAASSIVVDMLVGYRYLACAWTAEDWDREALELTDTWTTSGGGRLWLAQIREPGRPPMAFRPHFGPAPRCSWPDWLDIEVTMGNLPLTYRFSLWPHGVPVRSPSANVAHGDGEVAFIGVELITTFEEAKKLLREE